MYKVDKIRNYVLFFFAKIKNNRSKVWFLFYFYFFIYLNFTNFLHQAPKNCCVSLGVDFSEADYTIFNIIIDIDGK